MKNFSIFAAVALSASALAIQPAIASENSNSTATAAAAANTASTSQPTAKKYCAMTEATGSRVPKRVCLTEREWNDEGVDIARKAK